MDNARRAFLRGAALDNASRQAIARETKAYGPSPPGLGDTGPDACVTCSGFCAQACGQGIVFRHSPGHALEGTPYLKFDDAGCTFCGDCLQSCPQQANSEAIPSKLDSLSPKQLPPIRLDSSRCLAWNQVICISCLGHCDYQALHRDKLGHLFVEEGPCTGCGACVSVCPVGALQSSTSA